MLKSNKGQIPYVVIIVVAIFVIAIIFVPKIFQGGEEYNVDLPPDTTSHQIIPANIQGYSKVETDDFIRTTAKAGVGLTVTVTTESISTALQAAQITDNMLQCYQDAGAFVSNGFYKKDDPIRAGFIIVGDSNSISDPKLHYGCIKGAVKAMSIAGIELTPCVKRLTLKSDTNSFYVLITGTDTPVCETIKENTIP